MKSYVVPAASSRPKLGAKQVYLMANGDLRLSANQRCWAAQEAMEREIVAAVDGGGLDGRPRPSVQGGPEARIHQLAEGRRRRLPHARPRRRRSSSPRRCGSTRTICCTDSRTHQGPILTLANWSGTWPGLVGMLNLNGSLTKAGVKYSTLWADDFADPAFSKRLARVAGNGPRRAPARPRACRSATRRSAPPSASWAGRSPTSCAATRRSWACSTKAAWGCSMRSSPTTCSTRPACSRSGSASRPCTTKRRRRATTRPAPSASGWKTAAPSSSPGPKHEEDLTDDQILLQCKMYIAAMRIADDFGCDCVGIQYQQGLKDLLPASDLVEGTLNDSVRPPVKSRDGKRELYAGRAAAALQRSRRVRGPRRPDDLPRAPRDGPAGGKHAARPALGRRRPQRHDRRFRVGVRNLRQRAAVAPHRRLGRRDQRASAGDVLPQRRRHDQGHLEARRSRLVARLHRRRPAEDGPRPGRGDRAAARGNRSAAGTKRRRNGRSCTR